MGVDRRRGRDVSCPDSSRPLSPPYGLSRWPVIRARILQGVLAAILVLVLAGCGNGPDREEPASPRPEEQPRVEQAADSDTASPPAITQAVYVPDYSHIYHGSDLTRYPLTTTLSVRNTDPERSITLTSVRYYNTDGELTRRYLGGPRRLGPLGTAEFVVEEHEISGGTGANFIVEWSAERPVSRPVIESVMIGTRSGQGISFTSRGHPIEREPQ